MRAALVGLAALVGAVIVAARADGYEAYVVGLVALTVVVGVGLNILTGLAGQISLGHVGFYAIGAYASALLTKDAGWALGPALAAAAVLGFVVGLLLALPAVRVSGPYLGMVTIAFAFVVEHGIVEWSGLTGGANGIMSIPKPTLFGRVLGAADLAVAAVLMAALALALFARLKASAWGLGMRAVAGSEAAAASLGFDPVAVKAAAFGLSAAFAATAGGLFTPIGGFISPDAFPLVTSIGFVLVMVMGGAGATLGPIWGALVAVLVPELLAGFEAYRLLFVGILLLLVMLLAPSGIEGAVRDLVRRWRPPVARPVEAAPDLVAVHLRRERPGGLEVADLAIGFGGVRAVEALALMAAPGRITALIGPNGAGKSTALNLVSGFYRPERGRVVVDGVEIAGRPSWRIARAGVARTYQTSQLFDALTVTENVAAGLRRGRLGSPLGHAMRAEERRLAEALLAFAGYVGDADATAGGLAHVDRRFVEIARALATRPGVLLLDEPAAGLGPSDTAALGALLRRIATYGIAVVLVEHDMDLVMSVSDHVVVLDAGTPIAAGPPAVIRADAAVQRAYLGAASEETAAPTPSPAPSTARPAVQPRTRTPVLNVVGLVAGHGGVPVLHGIDLSVGEGETVAVLGANGAGKSTLLATLAGLIRPDAGAVELDGARVDRDGAGRLAQRGVILVPEGRQVFPELSVIDNLRLGAFARGPRFDPSAEIAAMFARFPRLAERQAQRAGLLSGGEQQMLAIARGLLAGPRVLLLDEPSLGLAPLLVRALFADLASVRDEHGLTLLVVDQMAPLALRLADRAYVLEGGRIVHAGPAAALAEGDALKAAYLGRVSS